MICGIIRSRSVQLPEVAEKIPGDAGGYEDPDTKPESLVKRFYRWLKNEEVSRETYFFPFAKRIVKALARETLVLVIDGTVVGRGCMALVIGMVYKGRALPIAWLVEKKKKGHFTEERHIELIKSVKEIIPDGSRVVLLGDGEFDGVDLQSIVNNWWWEYVLRTAETTTMCWKDHWFQYQETIPHLKPGAVFVVPDALFTKRGYGPVSGITWWRMDCKEPIHLVTNMKSTDEARLFYRMRFRIETCFSDNKGRGFNLQKSHLSKPDRINRLLMAVFLAYYWTVTLGVMAVSDVRQGEIHRARRCDLSLFKLGLRLLNFLLERDLSITVSFHLLC